MGSCQTATNITADVRDPQGVVRVRCSTGGRPTAGTSRSRWTNDRAGWFANLDTLGDKITIPNPPTGTLRWYIRAIDEEGAATRSTRDGHDPAL